MFKQDWMERQIETIAQSFAAILFGKEKLIKVFLDSEEQENEEQGTEEQETESSTQIEEEMIKRVIKNYVTEKKYKYAENMIFKLIETKSSADNLEVAICFYNELNDIDDETLEQGGFSRDQIKEGIAKLRQFYQ